MLTEEKVKKIVAKMIEKRDVKGLIKSLDKSSSYTWGLDCSAARALRSLAETSLEELKKVSGINKSLNKQLTNKSYIVREEIAHVLDRLGWTPVTEKDKILFLYAQKKWRELSEFGSQVAPFLIQGLKIDENARVEIALILSDLNEQQAAEPMWFTLNYDSYSSKQGIELLNLLAKIGKPIFNKLINEIGEPRPGKIVNIHLEINAAWILCEMGNLNAAEAVIDWIIRQTGSEYKDETGTIISRAELIKRSIPAKHFANLLGDYAEIILALVNWKLIEPQNSVYGANFDLANSIKSIQILCELKTAIASNILHKVKKTNRLLLSSYGSSQGITTTYNTQYLDFGKFQKIALEELRLRNNPRYQPAAYLDKKAWKI